MRDHCGLVLIVRCSVLMCLLGVRNVSCQDASSLISGLLSTFATSSKNPGCPGECRHALSALFCTHVQDDANCGDPQLRCCTNAPPTPPPPPPLSSNRPPPPLATLQLASDVNATSNSVREEDKNRPGGPVGAGSVTPIATPHDDRRRPPPGGSNARPTGGATGGGNHVFHRPPILGQTSPISVGTSLTVRPGDARPPTVPTNPHRPLKRRRPTTTTTTVRPSTTSGEDKTKQQVSAATTLKITTTASTTTSAPPSVNNIPVAEALTQARPTSGSGSNNKPCAGICVSEMVSSFCSRISETSHCSPGEACCMTGDEEMESQPSQPLPFPPPTPAVSMGTSRPTKYPSNMSVKTTPAIVSKPARPQTKPVPKKPPTTTTTTTTATTSAAPISTTTGSTTTMTLLPGRNPGSDDEIDECAGTCVMGLLSFLCDEVDDRVTCLNGGKCCITKGDGDDPNGGSGGPTTVPPIRNCPGICLPSMLSGVCNRPAVLIPETLDCESGSICCDNSLRETGPSGTTAAPSSDSGGGGGLLSLLPAAMSLLPLMEGMSGGSGGGTSGQASPTSFITQLLGGLASASAGSGPAPPPPPPAQLPPNRQPPGQAFINQRPPPMAPNRTPPLDENGHPQRPQQHLPLHPMQAPHQQQQPPQFHHQQQEQHPSEQQGHVQPIADSSVQPLDGDREGVVDERPACPGTCIASFLKMTCFGSSQIVDDYACPKQNLVCCAPRSTIYAGPTREDNAWNNSLSRFPNSESPGGFTQPPASSKYVCGVKGPVRPETPRVVGGRDATPGEWCWQVALINSLNQYLCGGALIGRQWVVTAAHCVTNLIRSGDAIYIRVGDFDLTSKYGSPGAQTLRVATSYIHHNHNSQTLDNNIALLKLEKPVELKEGVCLVCLPARGVAVEAGKRCSVTGYGYIGESGPIPLRIREARLPIVSEQECVRKINAVTEKIFILPASSFCAGGEEGHDACQGDGGGPLSCEIDGFYELTGVVSWGFGCGRADVPGIYVKISSFIGWINQIISVNSI